MRVSVRFVTGAVMLLASISLAGSSGAAPPARSWETIAASGDFVEIKDGPAVKVSLRYATVDNFVHANVYGGYRHAWLRRPGYEKFQSAIAILRSEHPRWRFLVWDALRPRSVQRIFWARVVGTDRQKYVADPAGGSIHNFGMALDVTLMDAAGHPLDMGTGFDDFTPAAEPDNEAAELQSGRLSQAEVNNRIVLRGIMIRAGFHPIAEEWWHFDAFTAAEVKVKYNIVE